MDDSEISILDSIRFFEKKNLDFELRAIIMPIKDLSDACAQWLVRLALRDLCYFIISVIHTRASLQSNMAA